ncbi:MAG: cyclase family protein [Thermoplasmata archaeon]|nr:cyclase family protein [Thermoplasmata archaeon]
MARLIDISMPIRPDMAVFRGDPEVRVRAVHSLERGDPYNLSLLTMGSHTGTHLDPPAHFVAGGRTVDQLDLELLNGPCQVVRVPDSAPVVGVSDVARIPPGTERVLFRTSNSARWASDDRFFSHYVALAPDAVPALVDSGIRLVGIDALSIERDLTGTFPVHRALLGKGIVILEGTRLAEVPEGPYELECLPLRIVQGDGAPARAVLRSA